MSVKKPTPPRNVFVPYIKFTAGNVNLSWKGGRPDYFTSLNHTRYVDQANKTRISLVYVPRFGENPNAVEEAISEAQGKCEFQYGFSGQASRAYRGQVTGYTVDVREGALFYNLELISQSVGYNYVKISSSKYDVPADKNAFSLLTSVTEDTDGMSQDDPADAWQGLINWRDSISSVMESLYQSYDENESDGINDSRAYILTIMKFIVNDYLPLYEFDAKNSDIGEVNVAIECQGKTPIKALRDIVSVMICPDVSEDEKSMYTYKLVIDDAITEGTKGKIRVKRYGIDTDGGEEIVPDHEFEFEWGTKSPNVISWKPEFNGVFTIFNNTITDKVANTETYTNGEDYTVMTAPPASISRVTSENWSGNLSIGDMFQNTLRDTQWFCEKVNYPYKAILEVQGIADSVYICDTYVCVNPYVNGLLHHSAGVYMVIGIEDSISEDGFTTKLTLIRDVEKSYRYLANKRQVVVDKDGEHDLYSYSPDYEDDLVVGAESNNQETSESDQSEAPPPGPVTTTIPSSVDQFFVGGDNFTEMSVTTTLYKEWSQSGSSNDEGLMTLDNEYLVEVNSDKYGAVGDSIEIHLSGGSVISGKIGGVVSSGGEYGVLKTVTIGGGTFVDYMGNTMQTPVTKDTKYEIFKFYVTCADESNFPALLTAVYNNGWASGQTVKKIVNKGGRF